MGVLIYSFSLNISSKMSSSVLEYDIGFFLSFYLFIFREG